jgi:hypothetical protein
MTNKNRDIIEKFLDIDKRVIYLLVLLSTAIPLVIPIGLPLGIDEYAEDFYNEVNALESGDVVLVLIELEPGLWGSFGAQTLAVMQHLFDINGIKFVIATFYSAEAAGFTDSNILPRLDKNDKVYGVDWVYVGYIPGRETAMAKFGTDFKFGVKDF